jgi:predicted flavoprotein YhiN
MPDVIVVGAGAAGIIAAWRAAELGAKVTLVEKTNRIGTKILISGGGKCNITHDGPIEGVLKAFRPAEARFIRPACYRFRNDQIVEMLTSRGLEVYTRPDGRIFPVDRTAKDVVRILESYLEEVSVTVMLEAPVSGLIIEDGAVRGVRYRRAGEAPLVRRDEGEGYRAKTAKNLLRELDPVAPAEGEERELRADRVVLCCGGSSYPNSGTTGDGWPWMREAGHGVERLRAALAPIYLAQVPDLAGVALRDCTLKARQGKEFARWTADLLFTHQGISGPAALGLSRQVAEGLEKGEVSLEIDLQADLTPEQASEQLLAFTTRNPSRKVAAYVDDFAPERVVDQLLADAGIPLDTTGARLDKKARNRLAVALKAWSLGPVRHVPLEKGEVVAGGVSLDEVDPQTMASKKIEDLFLCGEILDLAGPVGGYNLQAAFATGFVAGESAAKP